MTMKREICYHDVLPFTSRGELPECVQERRQQVWRVMDRPLVAGEGVSHHIVTDGDYVRIPLYPYLMGNSPVMVASAMLELGTAIDNIPGAFHTLIVMGEPAEQVDDKLHEPLRYIIFVN